MDVCGTVASHEAVQNVQIPIQSQEFWVPRIWIGKRPTYALYDNLRLKELHTKERHQWYLQRGNHRVEKHMGGVENCTVLVTVIYDVYTKSNA